METIGIQLNTDQSKAVDSILKWYHSEALFYALIGAAGTGKTFTTLYIIEALKAQGLKSICVSAYTHKARKVVEKVTKIESATVHSLLGYSLDEDLDKLKINNIKFKKKNKPTITNYELIIVDEASMLNAALVTDIKDTAKAHKIKVLFIGDGMQLPPVGEYTSTALLPENVDGFSELRQPARQKVENPLSLLLFALRADIGDNDARGYLLTSLADIGLIDQYANIARTAQNNFAHGSIYKQFITDAPVMLNDYGGYVLTPDVTRFNNKILSVVTDTYDDNPDYSKVLSFTNKQVSFYNKQVRDALFDNPKSDIIVGDRLMGYKTISVQEDRKYRNILVNTEEYSVEACDEIMTHENIKVFLVTILNDEGYREDIKIVHPDDYKTFKDIHKYYLDAALGNRTLFPAYYAFKNSHLILHSLNDKTDNLPVKDIDYSYGLTIHKSQGSTYEEVFIDTLDIKKSYTNGLGALNRELKLSMEEREARKVDLIKNTLRLLYVGFSRPKFRAYGLV